MEKLGTELATVEAALGEADIYEAEQKTTLQQALQQQGSLKSRLSAVEEEWLMLSDELEQLSF